MMLGAVGGLKLCVFSASLCNRQLKRARVCPRYAWLAMYQKMGGDVVVVEHGTSISQCINLVQADLKSGHYVKVLLHVSPQHLINGTGAPHSHSLCRGLLLHATQRCSVRSETPTSAYFMPVIEIRHV